MLSLGSTRPLTEVSPTVSPEGKGGRCIQLTTLPPSCANCLEILGATTSCRPRGLYRDCFTFIIVVVGAAADDLITLFSICLLGNLHLFQTVGGIRLCQGKEMRPIP